MTIAELISKYHRRPALYILVSPESTDWRGVQKIGTSASIPFRKNNWKTCSIYPVQFQHVFFLDPVLFPTLSDLVELDELVLPVWLKQRGEWDSHHICHGGGTEFFRFQDPVATLRTFLEEYGIRVVEELISDPFPFPCSPTKELEQDLDAEDSERRNVYHNQQKSLLNKVTKQRFLHFLQIPLLRRHQEELWGIWEHLLTTTDSYKGIVHWPTGTGKTVGMLLLILLLHQHLAGKGETYRGILVAPQNNILNTLIKHIRLLNNWGIQVLEGHNARFNTLTIPTQKPFLLVITHAALADKEAWNRFPSLNHIHYDEVHRITGEQFYDGALQKIAAWNIPFVTGTSATPRTSDPEQHEKLIRLFGTNCPLHCVTVEEAVEEGWIAKPHFLATSLEGNAIQGFLHEIRTLLDSRPFRCGKAIVYMEEKAMVREALRLTAAWPWRRYQALGQGEDVGNVGTDEEFVAAVPTGEPQLLFACQKYREGSDISGIDFVAFLMGRTTSAHIIAQIVGRAMRMDYEGKVAICLLARVRQVGETEDAVLESVQLTLERMYPTSNPTVPRKPSVYPWCLEYKTNGKWMTQEESLLQLQNWYLRKEYCSSKLDLNGFKTLLQTNTFHPLDQTCGTLKEYGYFPDNFRASWGMSYYDTVEAISPGTTTSIRKWGSFPDTFYAFLKENGIVDVFDYDTRWKSLSKEGYAMPGLPKDVWGDNFWHLYSDQN